jgi:hypothetical protein
MSFWQRVGRLTAAIVRVIGGTATADWHVAAPTAGPPRRRTEPAPDIATNGGGGEAS